MVRNNKGFTYPLTLALVLSVIFFLGLSSDLLLVERKLAMEEEAINRQEYYFLLSLKKAEKSLKENGSLPQGIYSYEKGTVAYSMSKDTSGMLVVAFSAKLNGRDPVEGYGYYNITLKRMVKWIEK